MLKMHDFVSIKMIVKFHAVVPDKSETIDSFGVESRNNQKLQFADLHEGCMTLFNCSQYILSGSAFLFP